jgi:plastocyanin
LYSCDNLILANSFSPITIAAIAMAIIALAVTLSFNLEPDSSTVPISVQGEQRTIYINLIEPKGGTNVKNEPYPATELPAGKEGTPGGLAIKEPDETGRWQVSAYVFDPSTVVVYQGDEVTLNFFGINGKEHSIHIDEYIKHHFTIHRGELVSKTFVASEPGIFKMHCQEHEPNMVGQLIVLPRV